MPHGFCDLIVFLSLLFLVTFRTAYQAEKKSIKKKQIVIPIGELRWADYERTATYKLNVYKMLHVTEALTSH